MLKLSVSILAIGVLSVSGTPVSNFGRELQFYTNNPYSVFFNSELITISHYRTANQTHHITLHSADSNSTICRVAIEANKNDIVGIIQAFALKNKIVVWGERINYSRRRRRDGLFKADIVILLIDPLQCTYKSIPDIVDEVPYAYPTYIPIILGHDDRSFDIFFASQKECSPCRFDDEGIKINLRHQLQAENEIPGFFTRIEYLKEAKQYAYVYNFPNNTGTVKMLNEDFSVDRQIWIDEYAGQLAVSSNGNKSYIGINYSPPIPMSEQTDYLLFDSDLFLISRVTLPLIDYHSPISNILNIDSSGRSFITFTQSSRINRNIIITSLKYDPEGQLSGHYVVYQTKGETLYSVQVLMFDNREYCIVVHEAYDDNDVMRRITKIKCIDVAKIAEVFPA